MKTKELGQEGAGGLGSDFADVGEPDMFGLDEFGDPVGMSPLWGAVIAGGLGTGATIVTRAVADPTSGMAKWSEGIGFLTGALASGFMMLFPNSRAAGWAGVATAFVTNGLRQLENMLMTLGTAGYGWAGAVVEPAHVLQGNGLGIATVEPGYAINGLGRMPELVGPPLRGDYGMGMNPGVQQTQILGGPTISGLGAHYGATVFGSNN
jgi:hypothetical protein